MMHVLAFSVTMRIPDRLAGRLHPRLLLLKLCALKNVIVDRLLFCNIVD